MSTLADFSENLKREARARGSQRARDVNKLKVLINKTQAICPMVANAKWSLAQTNCSSTEEIDAALKGAWEETIHEYEQLVAKIRFDCAELTEPLPAFLLLSKSTPRKTKEDKEDPLPPGFC